MNMDHLKATLEKVPNLITTEGTINIPEVHKQAQEANPALIRALAEDPQCRARFFQAVGKMQEAQELQVFLRDLLIDYISHKDFLANSYTQYKNKIGLASADGFIKASDQVVLRFPFKDCVLEGGQSKDDEKRQEVYLNEVLAGEEIDRLFSPKVLSGGLRINQEGAKATTAFNRNEAGKITDNLLIKGNNLIALHSLAEQFRGQVKLIYIDPPYNTGSQFDTFVYNNNFKRSTWLVFMKNRLEIAKKLLRSDGVLVCAIDENEQVYLGVLLKEIFNEENYEHVCVTIVHNPRGIQGTNFSYTHEYAFFVYPRGTKSIGNRKIDKEDIDWSQLRNWGAESERTDAKNCFYPLLIKDGEVIGFGDVVKDGIHPKQTEIINGVAHVYPIDKDGVERKWRYARQSVDSIKHLLRAKQKPNQTGYEIEIGKDFGMYRTVWQDKRYDANENGTKLIKSLVPNCPFSFPKSLWTVYDCLHAVVENDKEAIVLDFFAGSGTTAHAVLELNKSDGGNRQFILIEQMDYIESVTKARIAKVIENQKSGEFVYCELQSWNAGLIADIAKATTAAELIAIRQKLLKEGFLDYRLNLSAINAPEQESAFRALSLDNQKRALIAMLDKNQLYIAHTERRDTAMHCTPADIALSESFYGNS